MNDSDSFDECCGHDHEDAGGTATPRPWSFVAGTRGWEAMLTARDGSVVSDLNIMRDDAELIVRAVNAHDALIEALKDARFALSLADGTWAEIAACDAALRLAGVTT